MAKTPTERVREFRERKQAAQKAIERARAEAVRANFREPFFGFYRDDANNSEFTIPLLLAGVEPPSFIDESEAVFPDDLDGLETPNASNSLERAELTIECLADAARALARIVSDYKRKEITDRIREIENTDFHDHFVKSNALKDHARLQKMLDRLDKPVRWTFPQWKVE